MNYLKRAYEGAVAVYGWARERLWPIYSTGGLISAIALIAVATEKQILADHLYGRKNKLRANPDAAANATKLFEEEASLAVKTEVFSMSKREFQEEYDNATSIY